MNAVGIIGSYRKGHITDQAVSAVLEGAEAAGARTDKIYLADRRIEFCDNCRACTQQDRQLRRAECVHDDDMPAILDRIDAADAVVLASPVNFGSVTAITKAFVERLLVYVWWPWERSIPKLRIRKPYKKAVIITSCAAPGWMGRLFMRGPLKLLKTAAKCVGARPVKSLYLGLVARRRDQYLSDRSLARLRRAGRRLVC